jgi:hypothetical protein
MPPCASGGRRCSSGPAPRELDAGRPGVAGRRPELDYADAMSAPEEQPRGDRAERLVVFDEEINLDPPLVELLAEIERRLRALAARYGAQIRPEQRFELVGSALDELDSALERVRDARGKLARIEVRLVAAYERALAELRQAERDAELRSG